MKKFAALIAVVLLATSTCGCMSIAMHTKVQSSGDIGKMRIDLNTTSSVYRLIESSAHNEGYATVREYMLANFQKEFGGTSGNTFDYQEVWSGNDVQMILTAQGSFKPGTDSPLKIYRQDEFLVFEYGSARSSGSIPKASPTPTPAPTAYVLFPAAAASPTQTPVTTTNTYGLSYGQSFTSYISDPRLGGVTLDFYLEMPGKIVESNADVVNGEKAEWHLTGNSMRSKTMYARSEIPAGLPGFESILALTGVFAAVGMMSRRIRE